MKIFMTMGVVMGVVMGVMLISTPEDEATFMTAFGLSSVKREY